MLEALMWTVLLAATVHIICAAMIVYLYFKEAHHANRNVTGKRRTNGRKPKARLAPPDAYFPAPTPTPLWDNSLPDSSGATRGDA